MCKFIDPRPRSDEQLESRYNEAAPAIFSSVYMDEIKNNSYLLILTVFVTLTYSLLFNSML